MIDEVALNRLYQEVVNALTQHQQIVLLVGRDSGSAIGDIVKFAELINAAMITTPEGKSWLNQYHPLHYGVFGFAGHNSARQALAGDSVGLILAIGTGLGEWSTDGWDPVLMNDKLIHIHHSPRYFARSYMARLDVCGKLTTVFETLYHRLKNLIETGNLPKVAPPVETTPTPSMFEEQRMQGQQCAPRHIEIDDPKKYRRGSSPSSALIKPQRLMCELTLRLPPETRFFADTGNSFAWTTHYLFHQPEGCYRLAMGLGSMGWAIGAAVGTALAAPGVPVVCITGDGSFLMSGQELTVAVAERLSVIFVILNDQALGMVKYGQQLTDAEIIGFELPPTDFAMMAKAMGATAYVIQSPEDFETIDYQAMYSGKGPTLWDVRIDPEEPPPMGMRARTLSR